MNRLHLRPYQARALEAIHNAWDAGTRSPAVVLPTGTGKTVIFSRLAADLRDAGQRVCVIAHREELITQAIDKIEAVSPGLQVGRLQAKHDDVTDVTVASVQTLSRHTRLDKLDPSVFTHIIVDEAHHAAADIYTRVFDHFKTARRVGFSATLARQDNRSLGDVWDDVVFHMDILPAIAAGYLVNVRGFSVDVPELSLQGVQRARVRPTDGTQSYSMDYSNHNLGHALEATPVGPAIAQAYRAHATKPDGSLRRGIGFAPTKGVCDQITRDLVARGILAEAVYGTTPTEDRLAAYQRLRDGKIDVIMSVSVLTEGFDMPEAEVCIVARPTSNPGLFSQMVGRVLRPSPWTGKTEALVLDVRGVDSRMPLATLADLAGRDGATLAEGQPLTEAVEKIAGTLPDPISGEMIEESDWSSEMINLFQGSSAAWLQTPAGVWFIPTRKNYVFLWPERSQHELLPPRWKVGLRPVRGKGGRWLQSGLDIEMAMAWAESDAVDLDETIAARNRPWRKKRASTEMKALATSLGIEYEDNVRAGALSEWITIAKASKTFDGAYRAV